MATNTHPKRPPASDTEQASNRLQMLREQANLTPTDIASRLRVREWTAIRWERGAGIPDAAKLQLAEMFRVSVPFLMGWPDGPRDGEREAA